MPSPAGPLDIKLNKLPFKVRSTKAQGSNVLEPHYKCSEVEQIRDHFATGTEPNYSDFPVSVESVIAQDDWSQGMSPTRLQILPGTYWRSEGIDTRVPGQAIMGPAMTLLTGDFASFTGPVKKFVDFNGGSYLIAGQRVQQWNGSTSFGIVSLDAAAANAFTDLAVANNVMLACAKGTTSDLNIITPTTAPTQLKSAQGTNLLAGAYQAGYTYVNAYGESAISPLAAALTLVAGDALAIGTSANQRAAAVAAGATAFNFYLVAAPAGVNLGFLNQSPVSLGAYTLLLKTQGNGTGAPTPAITYDNAGAGGVGRLLDTGKTLWAVNQWAARLVSAGGQMNVVATNTSGVLTMVYPWTSIPAAASAYTIDTYCAYWWTTDGVTWTQVDPRGAVSVTAAKADLFTTIRFQVWKALQPNQIYSCTDPTSLGTWQSTATQIGDQSHKITSLQGFVLDLAIGKEDGLWGLDRLGNDYPILPELATQADANNCKPLRQWRSGLLFRIKNGLYRYEGSRLESIGLDRYRASRLTAAGAPVVIDIAPYTNEVFAILAQKLAAGTTEMSLASLVTQPHWHWNVFAYDSSTAHVPTAGAVLANAFAAGPAIFWGVNDTVAAHWYVGYVKLPVGTDNPADDATYKYPLASTALYTTEQAPLPDQDKTWTKVVTHALSVGTLTGLTGVQVQYAVDANIDAGLFTSMIGPQNQLTQTGLYAEWRFPVAGGVVAKSIQFKVILDGTGGAGQIGTYILKHLVVHYKHRAQSRRRWEIELICETRTAGGRFALDARSGSGQLLELLAMRNLPQPVLFEDRLGVNWNVFVEKVDYDPLEFLGGEGMDRWLGKVTLLEALGFANPPVAPQEPI